MTSRPRDIRNSALALPLSEKYGWLVLSLRNSACTTHLDGTPLDRPWSPRPNWVLVVGLAVAGLLWWSSERKQTPSLFLPG